jgi:hypothetical protein
MPADFNVDPELIGEPDACSGNASSLEKLACGRFYD